MDVLMLLLVLVALSAGAAALLALRLRTLDQELRDRQTRLANANEEVVRLRSRLQPVLDAEAERDRVLTEVAAERERILTGLAAEQRRQAESLRIERAAALRALEEERTSLLAAIASARADGDRLTKDLEAQRQRSLGELAGLEAHITALRGELTPLDEEAALLAFGFYKPHYEFSASVAYQVQLERVRDGQKAMIKTGSAAVCVIEWVVEGSRTEGKKMIGQQLRLMLRAFNGECDAAIAKVKYNNVKVMEARIQKAWDAINALGASKRCTIAAEYFQLKLQELYLAHEYQEKLHEEKEEQRRIREQMRDEEIARRQIEKAREEAEREERRYADALMKARQEAERAAGSKQQKLLGQIDELQRRLDEAHANKERAIARAQLTRSGHVYVISNIGSFGEHVYKIGMTRRLDPLERIQELGDASVPFQFDIHAIIYADDAPTLEATLHRAFQHRRINRVNERKEFFYADIDEIATVVREQHGEITLTLAAEAEDFRKTLAILIEEHSRGAGQLPARVQDGRVVPPVLASLPPLPTAGDVLPA